MAFLHLPLITVVLCSLYVLVHADTVTLNGFTNGYGMTGCLNDPSEGCGRSGDICFTDRSNSYAISGTAPMCNACMPWNYRNIATYPNPVNLPCALWRAYGCDDYFVSNVYAKSGSNSCWLGGEKSYNIENTFSNADEAATRFMEQCQQHKTLADYGLSADMLINEKDFCFPYSNNITDIIIAREGVQLSVLSGYRDYYFNKFNETLSALV